MRGGVVRPDMKQLLIRRCFSQVLFLVSIQISRPLLKSGTKVNNHEDQPGAKSRLLLEEQIFLYFAFSARKSPPGYDHGDQPWRASGKCVKHFIAQHGVDDL